MPIAEYLKEINKRFQTGEAREHSYRGDLQTLIEKMVSGVTAINEPKHLKNVGAPDYVVKKKDIPLGYIEAKDIDADLDNKDYKEQFERYRNGLSNLIITNYLEFRFYRDGEKTTSLRIGHIENGKIIANTENFQIFQDLISGFCVNSGQTIHSASKLAKIMAGKARLLADVVKKSLKSFDESYDNKTLQEQYVAFQKVLISDITQEEFSDVYAQTIAYGMFAGRLNDKSLDNFSRMEACECIPKSNPFLRKLFGYIAGPDIDERIKWIVDDLAEVFVAVDLHEILKDFGKATQTRDPIIHFYETFLSEYDPKLRKSRGVWYTPQPVVNFIVRSVDDILKNEFGLSSGLADTSKIKIKVRDTQYGNKSKGKYSSEIEKEVHRVQILDPATGTGTFLAEVIRQIHEKFISMQGMWTSYVDEHLLPRIHGFEILMASYAMAHLKLSLMLNETGYTPTKEQRLKIYLTNSLEEPHPDTNTLFATWLSQEATEANEIKRDCPVMVVLGNPPYSGISTNKGEWITNLIDDYKYISGKYFNEKKHWLNDDYVKFVRYAEQFIEKNNNGVLAYINNHSFIDNPTFRGMRWHLLNTFDKIYIIDLHGNAKKKETCPDGSKDENVFDIQQGVSINLFIKNNQKKKGQLAEVYHADLYGKREAKYAFLAEHSLNTIKFTKVNYQYPLYLFIPKNYDGETNYNKGFSLQSLFISNVTGIVTSRDTFVIDNYKLSLERRIKDFCDKSLSDTDFQNTYHLSENYQWKLSEQRSAIPDYDPNLIQYINYRPFDNKYIYYQENLVFRPRQEVMRHFINHENYGLVAKRGFSQTQSSPVFVADNIIDFRSWSCAGMQGGDYIFPLYLYDDIDNSRRPNFNSEIIQKFADGLKLQYVTEKSNQEGNFAPLDVLDYIYAVLHSPKYRETYKEFLKIDFPRIPYPKDKSKFRELVALGSELRKIHLLESDKLNTLSIGYPVSGSNVVDKITFAENKVYINATQYFDNVPDIAWNFYIGGYQPAQKWLKDRKNQELTFDDICHYQKIINALYLTNNLMQQIDAVGVI